MDTDSSLWRDSLCMSMPELAILISYEWVTAGYEETIEEEPISFIFCKQCYNVIHHSTEQMNKPYIWLNEELTELFEL